MNENKLREIGGIDYSKLKVQNGNITLDFEELLINVEPMKSECKKIDIVIDQLSNSKIEA